jgi:TrmH family RNA methyltransferase
MMLTKNRVKQIIALQKKKVREEERLFVVEGDKIVKEFLSSGFRVQTLVAKPEFINNLKDTQKTKPEEIFAVSFDELRKMSSLSTPHNALALIRMPEERAVKPEKNSGLFAALDCIQDPGNLGTIIRSASWFGIDNVICSNDCADIYNPKVIQATMGAILSVRVYYTDLKLFLNNANKEGLEIYGTVLEGRNIYSEKLENEGVILLGNESRGISDDLKELITVRLTIPKLGKSVEGIESLNAAMAASIVFSEFSGRRFK